jgi:hypothetical protein
MYKYFFNPVIATNIILLILAIYIYILHQNNIFDKNFFHFGPGTNKDNTITFINTKVNTWKMVWTVWVIGFTTTALQKYYWTAISDYIYLKVRNSNVKTLNCHKSQLIYVIFFKIIISTSLGVLSFFTYLTGQLQFIIPSVLTSLLIIVPLEISMLNKKKYQVKNKKRK